MRLIPPTIAASTQSGGERVVFDALAAASAGREAGAGGAAAGPDTAGWTVLHALDTPAQRSLLYVGCTRALHRLVILADKKVQAEFKG
jgi:hypothetical protein